MPFTFLDVVLIAVFLLGTLAGAGQGMIRQLFSLAGLIFGIVFASQRYQDLAGLLGWVNQPDVVELLSFVAITVGVLIIATAAGAVVHKVLRLMALGCLDWLGGAVIGAVQTLLLVDVALILAVRYQVFGLPDAIREARIPSVVFGIAPAILAMLPPEFEGVKEFFH